MELLLKKIEELKAAYAAKKNKTSLKLIKEIIQISKGLRNEIQYLRQIDKLITEDKTISKEFREAIKCKK